MTEYQIDPASWFTERELKYTPKHFVVSTTPLTVDSKIWILNKLKGRFSVAFAEDGTDDVLVFQLMSKPAFDDPKESVVDVIL